MSLIVIGADSRPIVGKCRVCRTMWREGTSETVMVRHMADCAQRHYEATHEERRKLDFMKPQDPELEDFMRREYQAGRLRPDTSPV